MNFEQDNLLMKTYRRLTEEEISRLKQNQCFATDWSQIEVAGGFSTDYVHNTRFSGTIKLGSFNKEFDLAGGMSKHSGLYHATLHNVVIGDDCCIENVNNYISNYTIGDNVFIENVDIILTDSESTFGNGVEVSVLNETGGNEVLIYDALNAHTAYIMTLYRQRPELIAKLRQLILDYADSVKSSVGTIGDNVVIADAGYIKNVRIGDYCKIEGSSRLKNGTINSNETAPVHIGVGVIGDDFIISSGSSIEDGVNLTKCFIGQACTLSHTYSASNSLIFSNCQGHNGEACSIFAGPYTVTHHKSTLLISGMFSFMNAGSGSNQSNHMYKLGPIHQGIMERGAKTASDSYILWPAKVGAFSLVMGRHVNHQDTTNLPFSYLIEQLNTTYIMPGANLKSVGTIRDARKWPGRDARTDVHKMDHINYNLLSPYTIQKMLNAIEILDNLKRVSGEQSESYSYQSCKIKRSSMNKGLRLYRMAIDKFFGNSLITRLQSRPINSVEDMHAAFVPTSKDGLGIWSDLSGLIAPDSTIEQLISDILDGTVSDMDAINCRFALIHSNYYDNEWTWAHDAMQKYYNIDLSTVSVADVAAIVSRWQDSVIGLDQMIYEDAHKDFSLSSRTDFDSDPFVCSVKEHIRVKSELGKTIMSVLELCDITKEGNSKVND